MATTISPAPPRRAKRRRERGPDLLKLPVIGPFLTWRHSRLVMQTPLMLISALILFDGFTGPSLAPRNFATTLSWVHYRGLLVLALLMAGNLFCMGCPFMVPRKLSKWLLKPTRRWPQALRNKWLPIGGLLLILWSYEAFALWSSPLLTAWVAVAYFVGAFVIDGLFEKATFCKYVCPLGLFNFAYGVLSPVKISARSLDTCRDCATKDCQQGHPGARGCELDLFVPAMKTSMDCTLCMDCVHACPHDNIALLVRPPATRLIPLAMASPTPAGKTRHTVASPLTAGAARLRLPFAGRLDLAGLCVVGTGAALVNALAMIDAGYALEARSRALLHTTSHGLAILPIFLLGMVIIPLAVAGGAAALVRRLADRQSTLGAVFGRLAPTYLPIGFGVWGAHYAFHFLTGALAIVPLAQSLLGEYGVTLAGPPRWGMGQVLPAEALLPIQLLFVYGGLFGSLMVAYRTARLRYPAAPALRRREIAVMAAVTIMIALIAVLILSQPMQMRGTFQFSGPSAGS